MDPPKSTCSRTSPSSSNWTVRTFPKEPWEGKRFAFIRGTPQILASPYSFKRHGKSGAELSELLPHLSEVVDDIAIVKSLHGDQFNHAPAQIFMNSGHNLIGRPSMGSWLTYGLGSEASDLPGFVVLQSGPVQVFAGNACWSGGFLPTSYQGVEFRSQGDPVLFVSSPEWMSRKATRRSLDALKSLNQKRFDAVGDPEILSRISSYELAYRMQTSVPELMQIEQEPGTHPPPVRDRPWRDLLCQQLPAGTSTGGAGGAIRPALPPRMGPPWLGGARIHHRGQGTGQALPGNRPGGPRP